MPSLPTRILDIDPVNFKLRLWQPPPNTISEYACLSHCWGGHQPVKATKANLDSLKVDIPWLSLPKTFQDAVSFARSLGLRYLWIDSLCIVQDDSDDWNKEAARMASIYHNSSITLSATSAPNCDSGLFHKYPDRDIQVLNSCNQNGQEIKTIVRPRLPHWDDMHTTNLAIAVQEQQDYPLLTRAWVYQERLLSNRVLHFCKTDLVWECLESSSCHCGQWRPSEEVKQTFSSTAMHGTLERSGQPIRDAGMPADWHEIIEQYSALHLTYESDRLPALAGLSDQTRYNQRGEYLAGCWKDSLINDLLWQRFGESPRPRMGRTKDFSFPTWSWACVGETIRFEVDRFHQYPLEQLCEVMNVQCAPLNALNPRGNVSQGELTIRGHVVPVRINSTGLEIIGSSSAISRKHCHFDYDITIPGPDRVDVDEILFCLTLCQSQIYFYSLILRCMDSNEQVYERIGIAEIFTTSKCWIQLYPEWEHVDKPHGSTVSEPDLEAFDTESQVDVYLLLMQTTSSSTPDAFLTTIDIGWHDHTWKNGERIIVAQLNAQKAEKARRDLSFRDVCKKTSKPLQDAGAGKWCSMPQSVECQAKGLKQFKYLLGKVVTIV